MNRYKILIGISTIIYAFFIFNYPPSFYNDDSYFFVKGIENFSVIDFAPHFPGYPALIILGKLINYFLDDAKLSFFILSSSCSILIPLVIFVYVKELKDEKTALIASLLTLSSPYLLNLSLSMLSDSIGLFFLFLSLYTLEKNRYKTSGILSCISFFSRPSYLIIYLVGLIYIIFYKKEAIKPILKYFFITSIVFLSFLLINDGFLFIKEAKRFILGHFQLWGTGQNSDLTWFKNIFILENIPFLLLVFTILKIDRRFKLLYFISISYFLWIIYGQNPDNLRHIIPLILIANIFLAYILKKHFFLVVIIFIFNIYFLSTYNIKLSPIDQITKSIKNTNKIVASNRSIEILREVYNFRVADKYYKDSSKYLYQNKSLYLITTKLPKSDNYSTYTGRFIGEQNYYLIEK